MPKFEVNRLRLIAAIKRCKKATKSGESLEGTDIVVEVREGAIRVCGSTDHSALIERIEAVATVSENENENVCTLPRNVVVNLENSNAETVKAEINAGSITLRFGGRSSRHQIVERSIVYGLWNDAKTWRKGAMSALTAYVLSAISQTKHARRPYGATSGTRVFSFANTTTIQCTDGAMLSHRTIPMEGGSPDFTVVLPHAFVDLLSMFSAGASLIIDEKNVHVDQGDLSFSCAREVYEYPELQKLLAYEPTASVRVNQTDLVRAVLGVASHENSDGCVMLGYTKETGLLVVSAGEAMEALEAASDGDVNAPALAVSPRLLGAALKAFGDQTETLNMDFVGQTMLGLWPGDGSRGVELVMGMAR